MLKCLQQRLVWCNRTGKSYGTTAEQYSIPEQYVMKQGILTKAQKFPGQRKRYESANPSVVHDTLPKGWVPEAVVHVIDDMFLVQCGPLRPTDTITRYAETVFNRFVLNHFNDGAIEVFLLFDSVTVQPFTPKQRE